jgi:cytochrome b6-f complex iron-sulfur subunit
MPNKVSRRSFLTSFHIGWLASYAALILPACRHQSPSTEIVELKKSPLTMPTDNRSDGFTIVGTLSQLKQAGEISYQRVDYIKVLVIRQPSDPSKLLAIDPTCPHQGCMVRWVAEENMFGCPCHAGEFNSQGQPTSSPPTAALQKYLVKIEGGKVLVKLPPVVAKE